MKKPLVTLTFVFFFTFLFAQENNDSTGYCNLQISLLTCTPGSDLYSIFGHSALRVKDSSGTVDIIYNYGTFDFEDPSFYSKFIRGKLLYFVSVDQFQYFFEQYAYEQRGITEQILYLSCAEKKTMLAFLRTNAKEENKYYKYDFVYDNCTTRLRDIVLSQVTDSAITGDVRLQKNITFRNLIHEYLDKGEQYWSKLGIDILLGSPLDKKISNEEAMFLPDYLMKGFDSTMINERRLVSEKKEILHAEPVVKKDPLFTPLIVTGLFFLVVVALSFFARTKRLLRLLDFLLFLLCGALGALLLFMWFFTDHLACRNNINLLWAFPAHLVIAIFIFSKKKWLKNYFLFTAALMLFLLISWKWVPQEMNNALLPVVGLMLFRSAVRYKNS